MRMLWTVKAVTSTFTFLKCFPRRCVSPWTDLNVIVTHSHAAVIIRGATRNRRQFTSFHSIRRVIRSKILSASSRWWLEIMFSAVNLFKFLSRGGCLGTQLYCLCLCVHFQFHCCREYLFPLSLPFIVIVSDIYFTMQTPYLSQASHTHRTHTKYYSSYHYTNINFIADVRGPKKTTWIHDVGKMKTCAECDHGNWGYMTHGKCRNSARRPMRTLARKEK